MSLPTLAPHELLIRVYFEDTDAGAIVYHASYFRFAERARTEFLRALGFDHPQLLLRHGGSFVLTDCAVAFRRPARLDDLLTVRTTALGATAARLHLHQAIRSDAGQLVDLDVRLAFLGPDHRPRRLPDGLLRRAATAALEAPPGSG